MSLISWLNENNGATTALATIVIAIATIILTWITSRYAKTTDEMLKAGNKPEILIFLFPDETFPYCINLCIQNIGTGFAHDVKFTGDFSFTPILPPGWKPLAENSILKNGIDYLPPGKMVKIFLFMTHTVKQESMVPGRPPISEEYLDITVTHKDIEKPENFLLQFNQWEGYGASENQPIADIADTLKVRIAEDLGEIKRILEYNLEKRRD